MKSAKTADTWKRSFSLFASIMELVVADRRYAKDVADVLQAVKDMKELTKKSTEPDMWKRLFSLFAKIMELVLYDENYAEYVVRVLQIIKDRKDFVTILRS